MPAGKPGLQPHWITETPDMWRHWFVDKPTVIDKATHIVGNLVGYRSSSIHYADDVQRLAAALTTVETLAIERVTHGPTASV